MPLVETGLLKKIRISTGRKVTSLLNGEYRSTFRGTGLSFDHVREYQYGDDIRRIDWNVSARMDHLYIKEYIEERELSLVLLVDMSASTGFGSQERSKGDVILELTAFLLYLAGYNNDRVSVGLFTTEMERYFRPMKGRKKVLHALHEIISFKPRNRGTSLARALEAVSMIQKKRSVIFVISDFLDPDPEVTAKLTWLGRHHDVIPVQVWDPVEQEFPLGGLVRFRDRETGQSYLTEMKRGKGGLPRLQGMEHISLSTSQRVDLELLKFFERRNRFMRHG